MFLADSVVWYRHFAAAPTDFHFVVIWDLYYEANLYAKDRDDVQDQEVVIAWPIKFEQVDYLNTLIFCIQAARMIEFYLFGEDVIAHLALMILVDNLILKS